MLHVNLLRRRKLIDSLSQDIGQYPMIEISWGSHGILPNRQQSSHCPNKNQ